MSNQINEAEALDIFFFLQQKLFVSGNSSLHQFIGPDIYPALFGRFLTILVELPGSQVKVLDKLSEIPSETTLNERRFLYNFFAHVWEGKKDVLEIGPFLGGTSRAIATGMLHNRSREASTKLRTFDKFKDYYIEPARMLSFLKPMFQKKILPESMREYIMQTTDFKQIFLLLHQDEEYFPILKFSNGVLPSHKSEIEQTEYLFALPDDVTFDAVFVDGCKSWYGTKYFMQKASQHADTGAYFIFQDYGAFTCFWIPVFVQFLKEYFQRVAYVDDTYVYRLIKPLDKQTIESEFPDEPDKISEDLFNEIFREMLIVTMEENDMISLLKYNMQHAAALTYIGKKERARNLLIDLMKRPEFFKFRGLIQMALEAPTYTPENGKIFL